ncbi:MAG: translation initiation factor [Muribaculaceae bacterium]|nr:translation initiation factor [Muribaculaceae bacterium]
MNIDWKDKLSALQSTLPQGEEAPVPSANEPAAGLPRLDIWFEKKGRGGKQATIITGFTCDDEELKAVATKLKQKLGTGGSARGGEILIQGDRRSQLPELLAQLGYKSRII